MKSMTYQRKIYQNANVGTPVIAHLFGNTKFELLRLILKKASGVVFSENNLVALQA